MGGQAMEDENEEMGESTWEESAMEGGGDKVQGFGRGKNSRDAVPFALEKP
jgi:hypothetical protein